MHKERWRKLFFKHQRHPSVLWEELRGWYLIPQAVKTTNPGHLSEMSLLLMCVAWGANRRSQKSVCRYRTSLGSWTHGGMAYVTGVLR